MSWRKDKGNNPGTPAAKVGAHSRLTFLQGTKTVGAPALLQYPTCQDSQPNYHGAMWWIFNVPSNSKILVFFLHAKTHFTLSEEIQHGIKNHKDNREILVSNGQLTKCGLFSYGKTTSKPKWEFKSMGTRWLYASVKMFASVQHKERILIYVN